MRYRNKETGIIFENLGWVKFIDRKLYVLTVIKHPDNIKKGLQSVFFIGLTFYEDERRFKKNYERLKISEYKKGEFLFKKNGDTYVYWGIEAQVFKNEIIKRYILKITDSENGIPGELKYFKPEDIDSCDIDQIEEPFGRINIAKSFYHEESS